LERAHYIWLVILLPGIREFSWFSWRLVCWELQRINSCRQVTLLIVKRLAAKLLNISYSKKTARMVQI
jgi:hypothetical protein